LIAVQIAGPDFLGVAADRGDAALRAHVMIQVAPRDATEVGARLADMAELTALHQITGDYDLVAVVEAGRSEDLEQAVSTIRALAGVRQAQVSIMLPGRSTLRNPRQTA
jgi:nitrate reductase NapAB chaperone NapD